MHTPFSKVKHGPVVAVLGLAALSWLSTIGAGAQQSAMAAEGKEQPYVIEYYYKAKWGHAEEFLSLFKKNNAASKSWTRTGICRLGTWTSIRAEPLILACELHA